MKKQNLLKLSLFVLVLLAALRPAYTSAATANVTGGTNGPLCNSGGYFTPASVTITSGNTITFSVPANDPYAGGVQVNGFPQGSFVVPRGGSMTTQALTENVSYQGTWPGDPSCIKGSGTVTVQAASSPPSPPSTPPVSNPSSATSKPKSAKSTTTPITSTSSAPATQQTTTPETVVANTIIVGGKQVAPVEGQELTINQSQPLALSGTTVPNGKITLTIHSNPTTAMVQANSSGDWSYTVTGLEPGDHTIYATVTDPATHQTSASSKLLAFTIDAAPVASIMHPTANPMKKSSSLLLFVVLGVIAVLIIAALAVIVMKKRSGKSSSSVTAPVVPPTQSIPQTPSAEQQPSPLAVTSPQEGTQQSTPAPAENSTESPRDGNI